MSDKITVRVVEFGDRAHYQLQWLDPLTGKKKTKSSGIERTGRKAERDAAQSEAGKLQAELCEGRYAEPSKLTWEQFRVRYESEAVAAMAKRTAEKIDNVFDSVEAIINPKRLKDVTAERLSFYQAELRRNKLAESTIKANLAHLLAALRWAVRIGLIPKAPAVHMPRRAVDKMKGRPITGEEFDRMVECVERVLVGTGKPKEHFQPKTAAREAKKREKRELAARKAAPSWQYYLRGMYLSGLRLSESLELYWDRDDKLCVDLNGKRPMLRIPAALEKGNKDRLLPIAPEFAEFLALTPVEERCGPVFKLAIRRKRTDRLRWQHVSNVVRKIGKRAGIKVGTSRNGKEKFASLHDLRRSFGERWAVRVMPQVLMELMRHEDISTTMKFYVGRNAERTADVLWAAHEQLKKVAKSNTSGNTADSASVSPSSENAASPADSEACEKFGD